MNLAAAALNSCFNEATYRSDLSSVALRERERERERERVDHQSIAFSISVQSDCILSVLRIFVKVYECRSKTEHCHRSFPLYDF